MDFNTIKAAQNLFRDKVNQLKGQQITDFVADYSTRKLISDCYFKLFRKSVAGCDNCYFDAMIEICHINLQNFMSRISSKFALRAGALLQDRFGDHSKMCNAHTITDELALYHLATNPGVDKFFTMLPPDWQKQVSEYKKTMGAEKQPAMEAPAQEKTRGIDTAIERIQLKKQGGEPAPEVTEKPAEATPDPVIEPESIKASGQGDGFEDEVITPAEPEPEPAQPEPVKKIVKKQAGTKAQAKKTPGRPPKKTKK